MITRFWETSFIFTVKLFSHRPPGLVWIFLCHTKDGKISRYLIIVKGNTMAILNRRNFLPWIDKTPRQRSYLINEFYLYISKSRLYSSVFTSLKPTLDKSLDSQRIDPFTRFHLSHKITKNNVALILLVHI